MRIDDETIEQFPALFKTVRGFNAMPLQNTKNGNGKVKFTYSAITGHIELQKPFPDCLRFNTLSYCRSGVLLVGCNRC